MLPTPANPVGNIEEWLGNLESEMQRSVRRECRVAATGVGSCHWNALLTEAGKVVKVNNDILLRDMWNLELHKLPDLVGDTADPAKQEDRMEKATKKIAAFRDS